MLNSSSVQCHCSVLLSIPSNNCDSSRSSPEFAVPSQVNIITVIHIFPKFLICKNSTFCIHVFAGIHPVLDTVWYYYLEIYFYLGIIAQLCSGSSLLALFSWEEEEVWTWATVIWKGKLLNKLNIGGRAGVIGAELLTANSKSWV